MTGNVAGWVSAKYNNFELERSYYTGIPPVFVGLFWAMRKTKEKQVRLSGRHLRQEEMLHALE